MPTFNADEIFEVAEQMERNGAEFYRKAAGSADENSRTLLLALAAMEYDHERTFEAMRSRFANGQLQPLAADPDRQGVLYLQAMANGRVFGAGPSSELTGQESVDRIFEIAIGLEKSSIVFYQSMKAMIPPGEAREQVDNIIDQEMGHILALSRR